MTETQPFPNTLFLPDRAELAVNCLTGCLNPAKSYLPFCLMDVSGETPRMRHTQFDWSDHTARVVDALLLAKALTGSEAGDAALERLDSLFWRGFREDGLHYTPANHWSFEHANMHYQRSVLNALLSLALVDGSERAAEQARALALRIGEIAIRRDDFRYFPAVEYLPGGWPRGDWGILGFGVDPANTSGRLLFGLARLHELLGDASVADTAAAFARHVMHHSNAYLPDGSFATGMEFREGHFHSRAVTMLGVVRLGHALGDRAMIEWGRRVFDRARGYGTRFGWFPERMVESRAHGCETCAIVDMLETAIWLARSGYPEYWDDAERYLRNHLVESQLTCIDWCAEVAEERAADQWETTVDVARRVLGGFAGWSQPNDFVSKVMHQWDLYTCCCGQGVRGLFNAWTHAVSREGGAVRVNLLINYDGARARVRSRLPHAGEVEVTLHEPAAVSLRVPAWLDRDAVRASVGGAEIELHRPEHHRVATARQSANAQVTFRFPVAEETHVDTVLGVDYETRWRGDTVVAISPNGRRAPLYSEGRGAAVPAGTIDRAVARIDFTL